MSDTTDVIHMANETAKIIQEANDRYVRLKAAVREVELARSDLIGPTFSSDRVKAVTRRAWPSVLRIGGAVATGGGLSALAADPGAFASLLGVLGIGG